MLSLVKERWVAIKEDYFQYLSIIALAGFSVLAFLIYKYEGEDVWFYKTISFFVGIILASLFGRKGVWCFWVIHANIFVYFTTFNQCYYVAVLMLAITIYPKAAIPVIFVYSIDVFILCQLHHRDVMHVVYHVGSGGMFYFVGKFIRLQCRHKPRKLSLTDEERKILEYLVQGVAQDNIPGFSNSTVKRRLDAAKLRNIVGTTKELKEIFLKEEKEN